MQLSSSTEEIMRTFVLAGLAALALAAIGGPVEPAGAADVLPNVAVGNTSSPEGYILTGPPGTPRRIVAAKTTFTVALSNPSSQVVSVRFRTCCGTARSVDPGRDYEAVSGTLVFQPGQTRKSVIVPIVLDFRAEPTETFQLVLESPVNADLDPTRHIGTGIIFNGVEFL
jgi:hypothetical protein